MAFATETEDCKVVQVGDESVFDSQRLGKRGEDAFVHFNHRVTLATKQVVVMRVLMDFVLHASLSKVGGVDETKSREQVERAVDRGLVEIGIALANALEDLVCGHVMIAVADDGQDHFALRRQPVPILPQLFEQFRVLHYRDYSLLQLVAISIPCSPRVVKRVLIGDCRFSFF